MNVSTYALMPQGLTIVVLVVAAISALTWTVERIKQRRMERLLEDMEEPRSEATAPLAAQRVDPRRRQAE